MTALQKLQHALGWRPKPINPICGEALRSVPQTPFSISYGSTLLRWHEWANKYSYVDNLRAGELEGWRPGRKWIEKYVVHVPCLQDLVIHERHDHWVCDIQHVQAFSASKSPLKDLVSVEEMALKYCQWALHDMSPTGIQTNLDWDQVRITKPGNTSDWFFRCEWDGRLFLMNDGGSHHFAAARQIAATIGQPVPLCGLLNEYKINHQAAAELDAQFVVFGLDAGARGAFREAMQAFGATYLVRHLPPPLHDQQLVFLPRDNPKSMQVAELARACGARPHALLRSTDEHSAATAH